MSTSLNQSIPDIVLVGNPVPVQVNTPTVISGGSEGYFIINFSGTPSNGQTITFDWTDQNGVSRSITLTCKTQRDLDGTTFNDNSAGLSTDDYFERMVAEWQQNYTLYQNFDIFYAGSSQVNLTAKYPADISPSLSHTISNISSTSKSSGSDKQVESNHSVILDIWMEQTLNGGDFEHLATLEKAVQEGASNDHARFFIQEILANDYLQPDLPEYDNFSEIGIGGQQIKRFFLKYAEKKGDPVDIKLYKGTVNKAAKRGHLAFMDFKDSGTFSANYPESKFLTNQPNKKPVTTEQREYLYWVSPDQGGNTKTYELHAEIYYEDGTSGTHMLKSFDVTDFEVFYVAAGADQLSIESYNTNKMVKSYDVWLEDQANSNKVSDVRTYLIDRKYYRNETYFLFENELGGFDTLRATGEQQHGIEVSQDEYQRPVEAEPAKHEGYYQAYNNRGRNTYQVSTGHKDKNYIDHLQEALVSNKVYLIKKTNYLFAYEDNGVFIPVIIEPDSFELFKDNDQLYSLKFNYKIGFDQ